MQDNISCIPCELTMLKNETFCAFSELRLINLYWILPQKTPNRVGSSEGEVACPTTPPYQDLTTRGLLPLGRDNG